MQNALLVIAFAVGVSFPLRAAGDFPTNQPATSVLGQPDFQTTAITSGLANRFSGPQGVAVDPTTGNVFIADTGNHRVLRFSSAAAMRSGANPDGVIGQINFSGSQPNQGGAISASTLNTPVGLAVDSRGRLWIADFANNRVLGYYLASRLGINPAADIVLGQTTFTTAASGLSALAMANPRGVAVGPGDVLYVADSSNNRVLRFVDLTGASSGSAATGVLGQVNFDSRLTSLSSVSMRAPGALHADLAGRLWVADTMNDRVLRFDAAAAKGNGAAAEAVIGTADFGVPATTDLDAKSFADPLGVFLDGSGNLWVSDFGNKRLLRFPAARAISTGGVADRVLGKPDFATAVGSVGARDIGSPVQVTGDSTGALIVMDFGANRALRFVPVPTPVRTPSPAASISVLGKKKIFTSAKRIRIRGRAENASAIEFKAKRGRFKPTRGNLFRWRAVVRLTKRRTAVKVRAVNADGVKTKIEKVIILKR